MINNYQKYIRSLALLFVMLLNNSEVYAGVSQTGQNQTNLDDTTPILQAPQIEGPFVSDPVTPHVFDGDLRDLPKMEQFAPGDQIFIVPMRGKENEQHEIFVGDISNQNSPLEPVKPAREESTGFTTPLLNFEGISFTRRLPPDTNGDVGPNHYIQTVNTHFAIWDKQGNLLVDATRIDALWKGTSGHCATGWPYQGDPIVLYDPLANRWLMSQLTYNGMNTFNVPLSPFFECVAVSRTSDPVAGGWYLYDFEVDEFPDYPKLGVWPDAYYMSADQGNTQGVFALERDKMLNGEPARYINFNIESLDSIWASSFLPSDLDGFLRPPLYSPNFLVRSVDAEKMDPGTSDRLEIFEFRVNWKNPKNSTCKLVDNLPTEPFDVAIPTFDWEGIPQPGTDVALDPQSYRLMWRLQYRNFGTHQTMVVNQTIKVDDFENHIGIRWYELRKYGASPWIIEQQATYTPDKEHRWMGSIAMDRAGNMALGYSISSVSLYPSIRYTGRLVDDPPGTLPQGEATIIDGAYSQDLVYDRWGDYSSMNVDPVDDCTFWYTQEYVANDNEVIDKNDNLLGTGMWGTRIASFRFPDCEAPLDLFMLVDVSGSFWNDIDQFKKDAPDVIDSIRNEISDSKFGLGKFMDYPIDPFGRDDLGDKAYIRVLDLNKDADLVKTTIKELPIPLDGAGGDIPESQLAALYQAATGEGQTVPGHPEADIPPNQQANFRDGVTKLFLLWTDAPFQRPEDYIDPDGSSEYPGPPWEKTLTAIQALDPPKVLGVASQNLDVDTNAATIEDLEAVAVETRALAPLGGVDCDEDGTIDIQPGEPLVCIISDTGAGIGKAIIALVLAGAKPQGVDIDIQPESPINHLNPTNAGGKIPVVIFGSEYLDVLDINHSSLRLGVPGRYIAAHSNGVVADINLDGRLDYLVYFSENALGVPPTLPVGSVVPLILTGSLWDGYLIEGMDNVVIWLGRP